MVIEVITKNNPEFITCPVCGISKFKIEEIQGASEEIKCKICNSFIQVD
jgi:transcription elongation factor Elf1